MFGRRKHENPYAVREKKLHRISIYENGIAITPVGTQYAGSASPVLNAKEARELVTDLMEAIEKYEKVKPLYEKAHEIRENAAKEIYDEIKLILRRGPEGGVDS